VAAAAIVVSLFIVGSFPFCSPSDVTIVSLKIAFPLNRHIKPHIDRTMHRPELGNVLLRLESHVAKPHVAHSIVPRECLVGLFHL
jgi:hypothetical protein